MLYLYDNALVNDLSRSFNPDMMPNSVVRVIAPEGAIDTVAQMANDSVNYPIVVFTREDDIHIDNQRYNFSRAKRGVVAGIDPKTNTMYKERAIPIELRYNMTILTTNQADMDELLREVLFKYSDMYYLSVTFPYEIKRKVRFGVRITPDATISTTENTFDYLSSGKLYQTIIPLECEGCVLISYSQSRLMSVKTELEVEQDL